MAEIIKPAVLNERFTLYLNADGHPVQRTLREMTAEEVLLALNWSGAEAEQLDREAEPARLIAEALEDGRSEEIARLGQYDIDAAISLLRQAGEAMERDARLMSLVVSAIPQWRGSKMSLREGLRRYWPHGRAA
jgi:hypothetical protein